MSAQGRSLTVGKLAVPADTLSEPAFAALTFEPPLVEPVRKARPARTPPARIELDIAGVTGRVAAGVEEAQLKRMARAVRAASE